MAPAGSVLQNEETEAKRKLKPFGTQRGKAHHALGSNVRLGPDDMLMRHTFSSSSVRGPI